MGGGRRRLEGEIDIILFYWQEIDYETLDFFFIKTVEWIVGSTSELYVRFFFLHAEYISASDKVGFWQFVTIRFIQMYWIRRSDTLNRTNYMPNNLHNVCVRTNERCKNHVTNVSILDIYFVYHVRAYKCIALKHNENV